MERTAMGEIADFEEEFGGGTNETLWLKEHQNVTTIIPQNLPSLNLKLLLRPGVYLLFWKGECVWVGKSSCPLKRLNNHLGKIKFDDVKVHSCAENLLSAMEIAYIKALQPKLNINAGGS